MRKFSIRKWVMRNDFTKLFGGIGRKRIITTTQVKLRSRGFNWRYWHSGITGRKHRTKMAMYRRGAQGFRNRIFGRLTALKIRLMYGRRNPTRRFIK